MRYILAIIIGYLMGNIAPSYFAGKLLGNIDIRNHGSGNAGATNVWRVLGTRPGIIVFILDVLKGFLAAMIGNLLGGQLGAALAGCAVIIGHDYPIFLHFKGGKGISTSFGVLLYLAPLVPLTALIIGIIIIYNTCYVSLASIVGVILAPILTALYRYPKQYVFVALLIMVLGLYRHKDNIKRLLNGTENKIQIKKRNYLK